MGNGSARLLKVGSTAFRGGIWAPIWSTVPWVNASLPLTWHLDRFSRFAGLAVVPTNAEKYCEKLFSVRCNNNKCRRVSRLGLYWYSLNQGPDLQNILRRCYDYPTITTKLRSIIAKMNVRYFFLQILRSTTSCLTTNINGTKIE